MFANRRNSQKPDDRFYASFRQNFPEVGPGTSGSHSAAPGSESGPAHQSSTLTEALPNASTGQRHADNTRDSKELDATPRPFSDGWRLTPSLMDPNSFAFAAFANQPPGYYTPTPGGYNTIFHSQAGDLHTPGMGMNTPLSLPHSMHSLQAHEAMLQLQHFNPQLLHSHTFHDAYSQQHRPLQPQDTSTETFVPAHFVHQDSGYEAVDDTPPKQTPNQDDSLLSQPIQEQSMRSGRISFEPTVHAENFRFQTTLNAPTAMIRHADEIPITYLNKGQAYTMSIYDALPPMRQDGLPVRYRTYVRVSFEDEQQRARPGACWQLWKEGRGSNEAHQRGGKLLAVEFVDPNQGGDEELRRSRVQLETASFDGFVVTWSPNMSGNAPHCAISVRFNFLSTDFSHSKGVKGIPVRLCAKTQVLSQDGSTDDESEVCFSKVKLFRDHGAERKLSNDVVHVKKTIEKLKQQIVQAESGLGGTGKRKRSGSTAKASILSRPNKLTKHKRAWSMDSEADFSRSAVEEDLQIKLQTMQDMFSSTRPISILNLQGEPEDDPDLFPVKLTGDMEIKPVQRTNTWESKASASDSPTSNAVSPSDSTASHPTPKRRFSELQQSIIEEESENEAEADTNSRDRRSGSPARPVKMAKLEHDGDSKEALYALDIDERYQPPEEKPVRPVACFYVRARDGKNEYHRAVYLMQRTVLDLIQGIAGKFDIDPYRIIQVTHINSRGLRIIVDEDVVRELPEGQDMIVEFTKVQPDFSIKPDPLLPPSSVITDVNNIDGTISDPLEMWLNY